MDLIDVLLHAVETTPSAVAVVDDGGEMSFAALRDRVERLATSVVRDTQPGDRVAILAMNRREYVEVQYAVPCSGRVLVILNYRLHPRELVRILHDSGARLLIAEGDLLERLRPLLGGCPELSRVLLLPSADDHDVSAEDGALPAGEPYERALGDSEPLMTWPTCDGDAPATLVYTSGTTGVPKGAVISHRNLVTAAIVANLEWDIREDARVLAILPMCHATGFQTYAFHLGGHQIVIARSWDLEVFYAKVVEHGITDASLAPTMIAMLLADLADHDRDLSSLRKIAYGGMPMPADTARAILRHVPALSSGFGQSESTLLVTRLSARDHARAIAGEEHLLSSVGRPSVFHHVAVRDDADRDCAVGQVGELCIHGDMTMLGYWGLPEASAEALRGGWLHTGDLARTDEEGFVYLVDRKKDLIISGSQNIYPREIELVLLQHPAIADAAVVGVPDPVWGESVAACVVRADGAALSEAEVIEHCRDHVAGYKKPKQVVFVDALPRNALGKVLKRELAASLAAS